MSKLNAAKRNKIPKGEFGMPGERKYPMPDASHAKNAKARASQMEKKGKLSPSSKAKIDAKANKILNKAKPGMSHVSKSRIHSHHSAKKR